MKQNPQNNAACLTQIKFFPKVAKLRKVIHWIQDVQESADIVAIYPLKLLGW